MLLFIVSGDIHRRELEALSELREAHKPIIIVFNQIDRYPDADRDQIYQKIRDERVRSLVRAEDIVMTAARPDPIKVKVREPDGSTSILWERPEPLIEPLKKRILEVLESEGKALVALNTLLFAGDLHQEIVKHKMRIRDEAANRLIWNFAIAKGAAVALNPIPVADMAGGLAIDVGMVAALGKLYNLPLTRKTATGLVKETVKALGGARRGRYRRPLDLERDQRGIGGDQHGHLRPELGRLRRGRPGSRSDGGVDVLRPRPSDEDLSRTRLPMGGAGIRTVMQDILDQARADSIMGRLREDLKKRVKL